MAVLRFQKFGTLFRFDGIPVYFGGVCITRSWMVWWWPVNWVATAALLPYALYHTLRKRAHQESQHDD